MVEADIHRCRIFWYERLFCFEICTLGSGGGEGDRRQGHGVVLRAGQLVDHGVHHHLPLPLRLDGRIEAELWTVSKVGVAGGRVC